MPAVLDTHTWIWWVTADGRLSRRARAAIEKAAAKNDLWLSQISIWEMAKKVDKGQLAVDRPLDEWLDSALEADGLPVAEMTRPILVDSCRLPLPFHGDQADQIIVAEGHPDHARRPPARLRARPHHLVATADS